MFYKKEGLKEKLLEAMIAGDEVEVQKILEKHKEAFTEDNLSKILKAARAEAANAVPAADLTTEQRLFADQLIEAMNTNNDAKLEILLKRGNEQFTKNNLSKILEAARAEANEQSTEQAQTSSSAAAEDVAPAQKTGFQALDRYVELCAEEVKVVKGPSSGFLNATEVTSNDVQVAGASDADSYSGF